MPKILLVRPSAGEHAVVPCEPFARIVLAFPAEHAALERPEGSGSLLFRFADGAAVELRDFYAHYGRGQMPEFEVNGAVMHGDEFFGFYGPGIEPDDEPSGYDAASGHGLKDVPLDEGLDASPASLEARPAEAEEKPAQAPGQETAQGEGQEQGASGIFVMDQAYGETLVLEEGPRDVEFNEHEDVLLGPATGEGKEASADVPDESGVSLTSLNIQGGVSRMGEAGSAVADAGAESVVLQENAGETDVDYNSPTQDSQEHYLDDKVTEGLVRAQTGAM